MDRAGRGCERGPGTRPVYELVTPTVDQKSVLGEEIQSKNGSMNFCGNKREFVKVVVVVVVLIAGTFSLERAPEWCSWLFER